jgi:hypothetical protein
MEPADPLSAERIYERRWASTLLDRVLSRLEDKYRTRGNAALFDSFNQLLADEQLGPFTMFYSVIVDFALSGTPPGAPGLVVW